MFRHFLFVLICVLTSIGSLRSVDAQPPVIPLWEKGAPGFEDKRDEAETGKDWWVANIHNPSLTVFRPAKTKANGTAVVIVPGGGHRKLVFEAEGTLMAEYMNKLGVTAFVLKHRLPREEGSPYDIDIHPRQDGRRAIRYVRSKAPEFGIQPDRIGMIGFSAGGEVVSWVTFGDPNAVENPVDEIDKVSAMPDFQVQIYPGPLGIPDQLPKNLPPAFFVVANDDGAAGNILKMAMGYREQKASVAVHLYAEGGHGFNMGQRSEAKTISSWPDRLGDWMSDQGLLKQTN